MRKPVWYASALLLVCGCTLLHKPAPVLPEGEPVVLDQLVIRSNFELPAHHRLLKELNAQRVDVSDKLGLPLSDEPIQVYLFQDEDRYTEFMRTGFPEFPSRRAFFVETDTRLEVYAHWGDRVAEDLRHEVCHGYLHSILPRLPLWLDEGLAEYFEVPRGDRGLNKPHVQDLVALWNEGKWRPDLARLEAIESPSDMTQVDYAESWAWVHLLLESEPGRRRMLHDYLQKLRQEGTVEPLSLWARQARIEPERTLVDHLMALAPRQPAIVAGTSLPSPSGRGQGEGTVFQGR